MSKNIKINSKMNNKIKALIFIVALFVAVGSYLYIHFTTAPSLESVISNVSFDTSEVTLDVSLTNKNDELYYTYVVSESNDYIKSVKKQNSITETSIVYKQNSSYFLYVNKGTPINIELSENDGNNFINNLRTEINSLEDYLDIDFDIVKYYTYSEESITFSVYKESVFYDYEIVIENNKLSYLKQVFTVNNIVNTVEIDVDYNVVIDIPTI